MIYIIGSGPSGTAAAVALLKRGVEVCMLDVGIELEQEKQQILPCEQMTDANIDLLYAQSPTILRYMKYSYGSDFAFRHTADAYKNLDQTVCCQPSYARGGLSNVWGAALMPYFRQDISDWPIRYEQLEKYYVELHQFLPLSVNQSSQENSIFTMHHDQKNYFDLSPQAAILWSRAARHQEKLLGHGLHVTSARLAVNFNQKVPCHYCGLCMKGCPRDLIYSSRQTILEVLLKNKKFKYYSGIVVEQFEENDKEIIILAKERSSQQPLQFKAKKVFLASGALMSTKILLSSMKIYNKAVTLKDSQHFILPGLLYKKAPDVTQARLHTLSQLYLELINPAVTQHSVHLQLYTYMQQFELELEKKLGIFNKVFPKKALCNRLIALQGYLHSKDSSSIVAQLSRANRSDRLILRSTINTSSTSTIKKIAAFIFKHQIRLGFLPILPMLQMSKVGGGNHYGGSFPMAKKAGQFQSNLQGMPAGFKYLHVVDASVLPSIPAQSTTYSIMANAYRIASESLLS